MLTSSLFTRTRLGLRVKEKGRVMSVRMRNVRTGTTGTFASPETLSGEWVPVEDAVPVEKAPRRGKAKGTKPAPEPAESGK